GDATVARWPRFATTCCRRFSCDGLDLLDTPPDLPVRSSGPRFYSHSKVDFVFLNCTSARAQITISPCCFRPGPWRQECDARGVRYRCCRGFFPYSPPRRSQI